MATAANPVVPTPPPPGGSRALAGLAPADPSGRVPHYIYSGRLCELRLVADATPHFHAYLPGDGAAIGGGLDERRRMYGPHFYVDQFSLLRKHAAPLASDLAKPHPRLRVKLKPISLGRHRVMAQLGQAFDALGRSLGLGDELDEVRASSRRSSASTALLPSHAVSRRLTPSHAFSALPRCASSCRRSASTASC